MVQKIIAVDIGGTSVKVGLINENKNMIAKDSISTKLSEEPLHLIASINEKIIEILNNNGVLPEEVKGIGICCPGPVNPAQGIIYKLPNIPKWENFNLKKAFQELYPQKTICVNNDANAATLGEWWVDSSSGLKNMIFISIGTGFGGGAIINGQLYSGADGLACEFGHMTIDPEGNLCGCGNRGCLEDYVSGRALVRLAENWLKTDSTSTLIQQSHSLTPESIYQAASQGDSLAIKLFQHFGRYLGIGLTNLINIFNPECIVFGGGVSLAFDLYMPYVREEMNKRLISIYSERLVIRLSKLKENAAMIGAAAFVYLNHD